MKSFISIYSWILGKNIWFGVILGFDTLNCAIYHHSATQVTTWEHWFEMEKSKNRVQHELKFRHGPWHCITQGLGFENFA